MRQCWPVLLVVLAGCSHRVLEFKFLATQPVDLGRAGTFKRTAAPVRGEDSNHIIIVVPTKLRAHDLNEAIRRAVDSVPGGVALMDGVVTETKFQIPFVYGYYAYRVEGKVLVDPARWPGGTRQSSGEGPR